ncbi:hypothetical protein HMPREF1408_00771 [Helicobacter pylori GAM245Ai]|nr:hypothetical protein HMPREF1408_00771 [Helicobacter pylori GAM245Ai]EMH07032.1 hypothetical protein HMPREF1407_00013 [Helicobacter pylori GAM244Ai]EMH32199.1 hypothetical protein HMPREF1423_00049 [Helicobacter pylori GAM270ASi]EMH49535.1 hypothetical protein HMPREF1437_00046 [Helicobacter pylori HP116Bi]ERA59107.1 hypothetical protein HMPREF1398_00686 [Helicobacter pylori GAM117Ai]
MKKTLFLAHYKRCFILIKLFNGISLFQSPHKGLIEKVLKVFF